MFEETLPFKEYNRANKERARDMRKNMTPAEIAIWEQLLRNKKTGYLFLRQKLMGSFILDFYCSKLLLGIEIDGSSHNNKQDYDEQREERMRHNGIRIIRFTNEEVMENMEGVQQELRQIIEERIKELESSNLSLPLTRKDEGPTVVQ